jgi:tetratricopeptide (TPR) repeat protein
MRLFVFLIALTLLAESRTDQQIAAYQKLPVSPKSQLALAKAYIQKVRETADFSYLDRASRIVDQVLSEGNAAYEAMRLRSEIELERHRFEDVAEYSEELTRLNPSDPWNWGTLGDALMELGEYDRAGAAYKRMVDLRPDLSSLNRMSHYRFVTGDAAGAIVTMEQAVAAGSDAPEHVAWCQVDLGNLHFKTGALEKAESSYRRALDTFAGYYPALAGLGKVAAARGNRDAAIGHYLRAYNILPLPEYAAALDALYTSANRMKEAAKYRELIAVVDKVARATGESTDRALAMIYLNQNRNIDRASELIEAELLLRQDVYTFDALAWLQYRRGEYQKAWESIRTALARNTPEAMFHHHASLIAAALGNHEESERHLRSVYSLNPHFQLPAPARDNVGDDRRARR